MDDIHVFIILFLALLFLCRISKEGFEEMEPGGNPVNKEPVDEEPVDEEPSGEEPSGEEPALVPPPVPKEVNGSFQGWDKRKVFSSPTAPNFGSLLELKEIEHLNKLFSNRNADPNVPSMPIDSQMPSLSEGSSVPNMLPPSNGGPAAAADAGAAADEGAEVVELHMVYADWCGHSKNALGDFEKLVDKTDVKTSSGKTVKFVLTEEKSEGMKEFKGKVKGFPTYMVKDASGLSPVDVGDRSESSIVDAAQKL
tara:strand:+ start:2898 stop:3656 length:759 start_codon:yes stop_codon:yes gene_type:complete